MAMNTQDLFPIIRKKCHDMASFSRYAYLDGGEAKLFFKSRGFKNHKFFDKGGSQAHVVWDEEEVVIAFRGTEPSESADLKADLNAWPDQAELAGWVHNGFQNALDKIWKDILKLLSNHYGKKISLCGHSLGGAMATIAASRLKDSNPKLYTFGSPRVGNSDFVKAFSSVVHYRFVNNNDIVPTIPMAWMGYRHHGMCMYINHYGNIRDLTWWQKLKDKFRGRWRALQKGMPFDGLYDHSCDYYCLYTSGGNHGEHV